MGRSLDLRTLKTSDDGKRGYVAVCFAAEKHGVNKVSRYQVDFQNEKPNHLYPIDRHRIRGHISCNAVFIYYLRFTFTPMKLTSKLVKNIVQAWWNRTLPIVDLDNGGKTIPPPTEKEWMQSVSADLDRIIYACRKELMANVEERGTKLMLKILKQP